MKLTKNSIPSPLIHALLASSLFATLPIPSRAALVPIVIDTTTGLLPDLGQGYLFVNTILTPALELTVTDGYNVGQSAPLLGLTGSGSIDVQFSGFTNTVIFAGSGTVAADIGFTNPVSDIQLEGNGKTVTFNGNVFTDQFQFTDAAIAKIASDKSIFAPVTTDTADQGTLIFLGNATINFPLGVGKALENVTFNGAAGTNAILNVDVLATDTNVNNGGTLTITQPRTIDGNLTISNNSTLALNTQVSPLTVSNDFKLGDNTTLSLDLQNTLTSGLVDAQNTATVSALSKVVVQNPPGNVPGGKAVIPIVEDSIGGGADLNVIPVTSNSILTTFSTQVTGNLLELVVQNKTVTSVLVTQSGSCNVNKLGIIAALDDISVMELSGTLKSIVNQLGTFTANEQLCHSLSMLSPIVDGAVLQESFENQDYTFNNLSQRINKIQFCKDFPNHYACKASQGYSAGDLGNPDGGIWLRTFGRSADQDARQGIAGYENSSVGIIGGTDLMFTKRALGGVAFSWSHLNLDHDISTSEDSVNSYQLSLYGSYDFKNPLYFVWNLALAYNDYSAERNVMFGNLFLPSTARYHGWQSGGKVEFGYDCRYIKYFDDFFHIQPSISLFYSHLDLSAYSERGLNTAIQQVDSAEFNMLKGGLGYKALYDLSYHGILYQSEAHIRGFYDFIGDTMELTSQFVGAGPSFQTVGFRPARASINLGLGVTAYSLIGFYLTATYDYLAKRDYHANSGYVTLRYEW